MSGFDSMRIAAYMERDQRGHELGAVVGQDAGRRPLVAYVYFHERSNDPLDVSSHMGTVFGFVAALRILRGDVSVRGVLPPVACFEPLPFFDGVVSLMPEPPSAGNLIEETFEWLE